MQIGYKLSTESFGPDEIIRQAVRAEEVGFDFVEMSDHFHPWLDKQAHSAFTWSLYGAIAVKTTRLRLATGVTCPTVRYHPAIIAQAAATLALISQGRFTLGLGAGERLNEHVVGQGFRGVHIRHEMLREAIDIIRLLWSGGYHSYEGKHLQLEDARVFDLPAEPPPIAVAAGGLNAARLAGELADGLFATDPRADLVEAFHDAGGTGPLYAEAPLAWAKTADEAVSAALDLNRWAMTGWKVMAELPNPKNFAAATTTVRAEDIEQQFACGPDVERHLEVIGQFTDAGFDHIVTQNAGPDPDGFFDFFAAELGPRLRARS